MAEQEWTKDNVHEHPLWIATEAYYTIAREGFNPELGDDDCAEPMAPWDSLDRHTQALFARELAQGARNVMTTLELQDLIGGGTGGMFT